VKNAAVSAKKLAALLKKLGDAPAPAFGALGAITTPPAPLSAPGAAGVAAPRQDPIATLLASMLLWESSTDKALAAYARVMENLVDFNDLRVCMPQETVDLVGPRYPRAMERCERLRAVLRSIYLREHAVNLDRLAAAPKREAKKYIDTLEGIVPYAAARVQLLCFDIHAVPVDEQLRAMLLDVQVGDAAVDASSLSTWLTNQIKPEEGIGAHYALQSWVDGQVGEGKPAARKGGARKASSKREPRSGAKAATG
jgi:hypothetical protein